MTLNIVTSVKSYDELLQKVKIYHYVSKIGLLKIFFFKVKNLRAVTTLCARRVRAVNTLQQLLARCENVMDAVKTLWERRVDAVGTL